MSEHSQNTHSTNLNWALSLLQSYVLHWCFKGVLCLKSSEILVILLTWQSTGAFNLSPPLTPFQAWLHRPRMNTKPSHSFPFHSLGHANSCLSAFLFLLLNFGKMLICFKCIPPNFKLTAPLFISCWFLT